MLFFRRSLQKSAIKKPSKVAHQEKATSHHKIPLSNLRNARGLLPLSGTRNVVIFSFLTLKCLSIISISLRTNEDKPE
jgi:hypothetical protein